MPKPALPGGKVLSLYPPDSAKLNQKRIHEAEKYNTTGKSDRLLNTLNIHNPTIEVHLAKDRESNGAAVIVAPGGGHKILWVGPEGYDSGSVLREARRFHDRVAESASRGWLRADGRCRE